MPRFTYVEGTSAKFWEGSVTGSVLTVKFGRLGTAGQAKDKDMGSPEAAQKELVKLVRDKLREGYVEDAAATRAGADAGAGKTAEQTTQPTAPAAPGTGAAKYPFLFYGADPADWDGQDLTYDIRFVEKPDDAARQRIAEVFEKACYKSPIDSASPWMWAGNWAFMFVTKNLDSEADELPAWAKILRTIHEAVPIAEVVFWNTTEDDRDDKWTKWSQSQQPHPSPEPAWNGHEPVSSYGWRPDPSLGTGEENPAFEERRRKVRVELELGPALKPGQIGLVPVPDATRPEPIPAATRGLFLDRCRVTYRAGSAVALDFNAQQAFYADGGKSRQLKIVGKPTSAVLSHDGKRAFIGTSGPYQEHKCRIYELDLATGECDEIFNFPVLDDYVCAAPVGEDRVAIMVSENLVLAGLDGTEYDLLHPVDGIAIEYVRDGRIVLLKSSASSKPVFVFSTEGGKLKKLGRFGPYIHAVWEADGHIYADTPEDQVFELVGIDEALAKGARKK